MEIPDHIIDELSSFLLQHEEDIAYEINDYGDLREVFLVIFKRNPASTEKDGGSTQFGVGA